MSESGIETEEVFNLQKMTQLAMFLSKPSLHNNNSIEI